MFFAAVIGSVGPYILEVIVLGLGATQPWYSDYAWSIVGAFAGLVVAILRGGGKKREEKKEIKQTRHLCAHRNPLFLDML